MIIRIDDGVFEECKKVDKVTSKMTFEEYLDYGESMWDDVGSPGPGSHPKSFWTKKAILETSKGRISQAGYETLRGMRLDDLRSLFLRKDGIYLCGSPSIPGATRRTVYYSLDFDFMREFLGGVA